MIDTFTFNLHTFCPGCDAQWGFDEMQFATCYCCGYPNNENENDEYPNEDDYAD